ncbi:MAG: cobalamin-binding protein [Zetaproteobacteria bacterium]|nr:cobalamin-binding protein [Zetaproteobacteria bacterium]
MSLSRTLFLLCLLLLSTQSWAGGARILALTPHACEMFFAMGADDQLVGVGDYCDYPAAARGVPRVASHARIHLEAALRLHPTVVVVMNRTVAGLEILEQQGIQVLVSNPHSFEEMFADMLRLGVVAGCEIQAESLVARWRQRLAQVRAQPRLNLPIFYELWSDPLLAVGGEGFLEDMIEAAGGVNVFAQEMRESVRINVESVVRAAPKLIIIPLEQRALAAREQFWRHYFVDKTVLFVAVDADLLHRPGPRLLDGLEQLQQMFQRQYRLQLHE